MILLCRGCVGNLKLDSGYLGRNLPSHWSSLNFIKAKLRKWSLVIKERNLLAVTEMAVQCTASAVPLEIGVSCLAVQWKQLNKHVQLESVSGFLKEIDF